MTYSEVMAQEMGYETKTTFWDDFTIAEAFGLDAIQDTFNRAFEEWKTNYVYLTELVLVLNHKIWFWHQKKDDFAALYDKLWRQADDYANENLKGEEYQYFWSVTD